jgi:hypothetical protein
VSTTPTQTGALLGNKKGAGPKLALHNLYLGADAAFDSLGGFIRAGGKRLSLAENSQKIPSTEEKQINPASTSAFCSNVRLTRNRKQLILIYKIWKKSIKKY